MARPGDPPGSPDGARSKPGPRNIELKARLADLEAAHRAARGLGARLAGSERQEDTYFHAARGRLKLRRRWASHVTGEGAEGEAIPPAGGHRRGGAELGAQLIAYHREDSASARPSDYLLVQVERGEEMLALLSRALGVRARVLKERTIYLHDEVRIHLDRVEGRGEFLELEAIVGESGDGDARARLERLRGAFKVEPGQVLSGSYGDPAFS